MFTVLLLALLLVGLVHAVFIAMGDDAEGGDDVTPGGPTGNLKGDSFMKVLLLKTTRDVKNNI